MLADSSTLKLFGLCDDGEEEDIVSVLVAFSAQTDAIRPAGGSSAGCLPNVDRGDEEAHQRLSQANFADSPVYSESTSP